ncbi:N-acyl-aromatic-L-amino acid amidohydrolase (carboxylate-forming) B-like protein [Labeo rohita]|uniref:N-acyl-aromatic-L-amino acid amidohydrolase n=1 Tax=Labeo rohita TaxID=84645 RepID=A0A498LUU9_LABRO|nr:N-acyl-aromatic-L-amino acid amidohydrolase (carboxylate-forming) B-like protein [Labeo rohita]
MALVSDSGHLIAFALHIQPQMRIQMTCVPLALEVGPQPHGVVRADIYMIMKEAVDLTIDWIHKFNSGTVFEGGDVEAFKFIKSVDYPRDPETRTLTAAIHPQLQDRDFCLLKRGDPLFFKFSGETVKYEEDETLHPFFINEAAYYEKGIAFHLAKKLMLTIPTVQMALVFLPALARMAVTGGTHGNEMSGVYVVQEMERQRKEKGEGAWPIPVTTVLSNPRAVKECRRYVETDMNRCFNTDTLSSPITDSSPYEVRRAQELNKLMGPKGSKDAIDLICDLHNTTSNMGLTLIHYTSSDWTKITKVPVRVLVLDIPISDAYSLESVSKHGFSIEVGPQPQGVVRADIYMIMKEAVDLTIDWIHKFNSGTVFEGGDVEAFEFIKSVDYPRDPETRTLTAAIHPQLQDRDFCLLKQGDPLFLSFSGETVKYKEKEPLHPFFINEAAYYEKGIAFHLGKKMMLTVPKVQVQKD